MPSALDCVPGASRQPFGLPASATRTRTFCAAMASRAKAASANKPPSPLCEELIEALLDPRLVEAFHKALSPLIAKSIDAAIAPLAKQLDGMTGTLREVKAENVRLTKRCEAVEKENERLDKVVAEHGRRLEDMEAYSRTDNLIIRGLPESSAAERATDAPSLDGGAHGGAHALREGHEAVESSVLTFFNRTLGVNVLPQDISVAHRIKAGKSDKVRPVIVRFANRKARNDVYRARTQLKGANNTVFIAEHLTKATSELFFEARKLLREKKVYGAWTQNGLVNVRFSPDKSVRASVVRSVADLALRR